MAIGVVFAAPARADAPRDQGWWTVTNPGGAALPVALPAAPPGPPDVPGRGLLVQAGPADMPTAYAALLYELDPGTTAGKLTLAVAPNSGTTPMATLQLCGLLQPINHPEQGGPMSDAPPFNCGKKVTAAPSADGKSYTFDAAGLVSNNLLAVAILPTGPADRVVFSAPDASSLATTAGSGSDSSPAIDTSPIAAPADNAPASDNIASIPSSGPTPNLESSLPGVAASGPTSVAPAASAAPSNLPGAAGVFVPTVSGGPEKATPLLVILFVLGALGGAVLWLYAGRQRANVALSGPIPG
jgi:hypothetical protein